MAQELSKALTDAGRGDVTVTGSDGGAAPDSNGNRARSDKSFNSYRGGDKVGGSKTLSYK